MKKRLIVYIIFIFFSMAVSQNLLAQSTSVTVTLPSFPVMLNGVTVENDHREYPLIVYKNITYFPMTYFDTRFLGLETSWDTKKGLEIKQTGISAGYRGYLSSNKNSRTLIATIPSFPIQINGEIIDNRKVEYPILLLRDVTYFPLTWDYAVKAFGWTYAFDAKQGLKISSSNPQLKELKLEGYTGGALAIANEHIYYEGAKGTIWMSPVIEASATKQIYQLPAWDLGEGSTYVNARLYKQAGEVWLMYHQGGGVMGSDHYIRLHSDGTAEKMASGYLALRTFDHTMVKVGHGVPPSPNNLFVRSVEASTYMQVGSADYLYGWAWKEAEGSQSGTPSTDVYMMNQALYLLAFNQQQDRSGSRIHKVDLETNQTTRVSERVTDRFILEREHIYFVNDERLYRIALNDLTEAQLDTTGPVKDFRAIHGQVYYVNQANHRLYRVGEKESLNPLGTVVQLIEDEGYLIVTFKEERHNPYRLVVFDQEGSLIFKSSDVVERAMIDRGMLYYVESTSKQVYRAKLTR